MDGVHPTHNVQTAHSWIKKGERKELLGNTDRSRVNLSGVIDVLAHKVIIQEDKTLYADSINSFLKKIEEANAQKTKIYLFCDRAPYNWNKSRLEQHETSKILIKFLPPCSPNLNPIQRLWKWMK